MENKLEYHDNQITSNLKKCVIAIVDIVLLTFVNYASCYITMGGHITASTYYQIAVSYGHLLAYMAILVTVNYLLGLYRSVWKFAGTDEIIRGFVAGVINGSLLFILDRIVFADLLSYDARMPFYSYILVIALNCICLVGVRVCFRIYRRAIGNIFVKSNSDNRIMIVGAGFMGNFIIDALVNEGNRSGQAVIAVDDNPGKLHKKINGVKIAGNCEQIPELAARYRINEIIICIPSATRQRQTEIINIAMQTECKVKISPSIEDMLEQGGSRRVRNVEISDLLPRPEIKLDKKVCRYIIGQTVLVTGGGGSIGSEICHQVARYNPKAIIIFDIYENCAFELANDLNDKFGDAIDIQVRIGSVRDMDRLREIMEEFHPNVVFHAAAHKHVPLMEDSPCEAVKNNVFGTYNVAVIADEYKIEKMVILSTDKAVNPTNVMGCTKRITEIIVQYMNNTSKNTKYAAVRFGNVLGSHGSVVPIFKKQIEQGGPIKVTHEDITRYFMTIPEAAQLVCQAGGLAEGGEVFVLDMGEPVRIMDLAKDMIRLSGFTQEEIPIEITGLRPGEKLYEELSMDEEMESRQKTANEKIFVNQPMVIDDDQFAHLLDSLNDINDENVREKLMAIVPNYKPAEN